jgi:hypothetical protein
MPLSITTTSGGTSHGNPFVGPIQYTAHIKPDISALTANEVDANGYLKPGVPFLASGLLVSGAGQTIFGVTVEAVKVAASNSAADIAAVTNDPFVAVCTIGQVSQDIIEDNLGRALSANEIAALAAAGCRLVLIPT